MVAGFVMRVIIVMRIMWMIVVMRMIVMRIFVPGVWIFVPGIGVVVACGGGSGHGELGETFLAFAGFAFFLHAVFPAIEPGEPDADLVEQDHRQRHQQQREHVRCGGQHRRRHEDGKNGIRAGVRHRLVGQQPEFHQHHHHHRQFEGQAEQQRELRGEGDVFADPPVVGNPEAAAPFIEEHQRARQHTVVGEQHAGEKQAEAHHHRRPHHLLLMRVQPGKNELQHEHQQQREREDDAGEERQLHREHEGLCRFQGRHQLQVPAAVQLRTGGGFHQHLDLLAERLLQAEAVDEPVPPFVGKRQRRPQEAHRLGVKHQVSIRMGLIEKRPLFRLQRACRMLEHLRLLPGIDLERLLRPVPGLGQFGVELVDPHLLDRPPQHLHELLLEGKADDHRNQQGQHDARDHHPQILKVFEERLLVVRVGLFPELDDFLQQIHAWRAGIQATPARSRKGGCGVRGNSGIAAAGPMFHGRSARPVSHDRY